MSENYCDLFKAYIQVLTVANATHLRYGLVSATASKRRLFLSKFLLKIVRQYKSNKAMTEMKVTS